MVAIPGPSVVPDRVMRAMHEASPDIYSDEFHTLSASVHSDLKRVVQSENIYLAAYIANGHGAWEAALTNLFSPGDLILVISTGIFAAGWAGFADALGIQTEVMEFGFRNDIDTERLAERLEEDKDGQIKAVLTVHVDTASSVRNDIQSLSSILKDSGHPALLLVDCIASLACDPYQMDAWGVDVTIAASQKGLMLPTGMAFVFFSYRAMQAGMGAKLRTPYWDWNRRVNPDEFYQTYCGTAPAQHLFGLREALDMILSEEGLENVLQRHAILAKAVWAAVDQWGRGGPLECNIVNREKRSHAVTALRAGAPYGAQLRQWLSAHTGVTLGVGLGAGTPDDPEASGAFRIGHMGHLNAHMMMGTLASIEAGFDAIGYPRGQGAIEAAAAEIKFLEHFRTS